MRGNYQRPSELLRRQKETGKSYWDLIDRPLYDEPQDDQLSSDILRQQVDAALERYDNGKSSAKTYNSAEDFITEHEQFRPYVYQHKGDRPTIGYGTTDSTPQGLKWIKRGRITEKEGRQALNEFLEAGRPIIRRYIKNYDRLPDSARYVIDDIYYNIGEGNLRRSPKFLKAVNSGDWNEAVRQMDWDNNKKNFGGAKRRNAARAKLFMRDINNAVPTPVAAPATTNWSGMRTIPVQTIERPIQTGVRYVSPAQSDPVYTTVSTGQQSAVPAQLDRYYAEKQAQQEYANKVERASRQLYANPLELWNQVVGYSHGKSYPFSFWNRNGNALKPAVRYGRGKD